MAGDGGGGRGAGPVGAWIGLRNADRPWDDEVPDLQCETASVMVAPDAGEDIFPQLLVLGQRPDCSPDSRTTGPGSRPPVQAEHPSGTSARTTGGRDIPRYPGLRSPG